LIFTALCDLILYKSNHVTIRLAYYCCCTS